MKIVGLDHVNIRTRFFERTIAFYRDVLGMEERPAGSASARPLNCWLASRDGAVAIHVNGVAAGETDQPIGAGALDHFALACRDLASARRRLDQADVSFEERRIASQGISQLVIFDPNGLKIELSFQDEVGAIT